MLVSMPRPGESGAKWSEAWNSCILILDFDTWYDPTGEILEDVPEVLSNVVD